MKQIITAILALAIIVSCDEQGNPIPYDPTVGPDTTTIEPETVTVDTIPTVSITTTAEVTDKENWQKGATMTIGDTTYQLSIKGRGNATWLHPKKPYALKLDAKAPILGMPAHKRWCLLNNYIDRTLMRNHIAFAISRHTSLAWTPRGQFVTLYLNGHYRGIYYLCEQIKSGKHRVNIPDDGWLLEVDTYYDEQFRWRSSMNLPYMVKEPDNELMTEQLRQQMQTWIDSLEASLNDADRLAAHDYERFIDPQSFADYFLIQELTMNLECNHPKSVYFHRTPDGPLTAGPAWDFDCKTWSDQWFDTSWAEDRTIHRADQLTIPTALYYGYLFRDPKFSDLVSRRWQALRTKFATIPATIDSTYRILAPYAARNYALWPLEWYQNDEQLTYPEAVEKLKTLYLRKFNYLDSRLSERGTVPLRAATLNTKH